MQGTKVNKLGRFYAAIHLYKNEARFKRSISYELILTLMGKLLFLFTWKANVEG